MATLRLHNVHVRCGATIDEIARAAVVKIGRKDAILEGLRVVRRSIDTRKRPNIRWSVAVEFEGDAALIAKLPPNEASVVTPVEEETLTAGGEPLRSRPVIIGAGPAGLFAALVLAQNGYRPIVVERGRGIKERNADVAALLGQRRLDTESNFVSGEGGAGAYSDGKLTTRINDVRLRSVLSTLVECGASKDILIDARPHIGSDVLPGVVTRLHQRIEGLGGEFRFGYEVERLMTSEGSRVTGVISTGGESIEAGAVILAAGNWAGGLLERLAGQGVAVEAKAFQVGVRIEHPQELIDWSVYGQSRGSLPAAEYIMSCPAKGYSRGVATFCMCPGGIIVPAVSELDRLSTNGMSRSGRDGKFANSALVVTIEPGELGEGDVFAGMEFQRKLEKACFDVAGDLSAPAQKAADFLAGRMSRDLPECSYPLDIVEADLRDILPAQLTEALGVALPHFGAKMPGFVENGLLVGVETRVSSPVRIVRDSQTRQSVSTERLFPCGEGSGYAGGIMSSAVDGIRSGEALVRQFGCCAE